MAGSTAGRRKSAPRRAALRFARALSARGMWRTSLPRSLSRSASVCRWTRWWGPPQSSDRRPVAARSFACGTGSRWSTIPTTPTRPRSPKSLRRSAGRLLTCAVSPFWARCASWATARRHCTVRAVGRPERPVSTWSSRWGATMRRRWPTARGRQACPPPPLPFVPTVTRPRTWRSSGSGPAIWCWSRGRAGRARTWWRTG